MWKRFKTALTILGGLDLAVSTLICISLAVEAHETQKEQERVDALRKAIHDSGIWAKPGATNIPIDKEV
jgi:hypothetical protein